MTGISANLHVTPGQLAQLRAACDGLVAYREECRKADPDADRNRFVYEERMNLTSNTEIIRQVKLRTAWEPLGNAAAVRKAADKHADDNGLPHVPRRPPGRRKGNRA
jgi:hypothetical protein